MSHIFISLGSNLGDRAENLARARAALRANGLHVVRESKVHESEEWRSAESSSLPHAQNNYLNQCLEVTSELSPVQVFHLLRTIEVELGRDRQAEARYKKEHHAEYAPRLIDLDILLYDDWFVREDSALKNKDGSVEPLVIPHPLMHLREFVLAPLAEIAPKAVHPLLHKTVTALLAGLK